MPTRANAGNTEDSDHAQKHWGRIGVITAGFMSPFYGQIVEGICNYLTSRQYQALVQSNLHSRMSKLLANSTLTDLQCDGLIIHADTLSDNELNALLERYGKAILMNRHLEQFPGQCVYTDNVLGGRLAARCLLNHGHQNIGMIAGPNSFSESHQRTAGFESELELNGLELAIKVEGDFHEARGAEAMEALLDSGKKFTAVFIHNDEMAFGALTTCRLRGVRVPEDLSMIGYDGLAMCEFVAPKLTTIQQPLRQLGEQAASILCAMLDGSDNPIPSTANVHTPVLAERESVAPPHGYRSQQVVLTQREIECLTWTARGKTSWEISVILGVSESTATFHLRNAVIKLQASNRTHAVAKALQSGLIELVA